MGHDEKHETKVFDPDDVRILSRAFDEAWKAVQGSGCSFASNGHSQATREFLARRILEMEQIERDSIARATEGRAVEAACEYHSENGSVIGNNKPGL